MASEFALRVVKAFESFSPDAYECPGGEMTIGFGHVILPTEDFEGGPITMAAAEDLLARDFRIAQTAVLREVAVLLEAHELEALASFVFNLGQAKFAGSTLLKRIRAGDRHGAAKEFLRWIYAKSKPQRGLIRRRHAECVWFLGAPEATVLYLAESGWDQTRPLPPS